MRTGSTINLFRAIYFLRLRKDPAVAILMVLDCEVAASCSPLSDVETINGEVGKTIQVISNARNGIDTFLRLQMRGGRSVEERLSGEAVRRG